MEDYYGPGFTDDVSMAMAWDFPLGAEESALINLILSETAPASGFYLTQTDPASGTKIYFSSTLDITPVPEPGTLMLLSTGFVGLLYFRRKNWS